MRKILRTIGDVIIVIASQFDQRDILLYAGLALAAYGLSMISMPAAFIVPGAVLAGVAIFGVR